LNGSAITQDKDETRILYKGDMVPFSDILLGKVQPPSSSEPFLAVVKKYSAQAVEHGQAPQPTATGKSTHAGSN